ncbi:MAG: GerMN domain-containing protein [Candidatus Krumholzibacteria bacterium]|nr:GerMN domain-containing protein [Candidatus Krumholzibacteria bacterium]
MNDTQLPEDEEYSSHGTLKERHLILIAAAAIIIGGLVFYYVQQRQKREPAAISEGVVEVPEGSRAVTLYFADREEEALVAETRLVAIGKEFVEQIEQVVRALLVGPEEDGVSTIAQGTRLLDAFYDSDSGTLYLDFSSELVAGHPGGSSAEYYTVAAIMRTISQNFPEVKAVQMLVEGLQVGTIAGHLDAYKPFLVADWR